MRDVWSEERKLKIWLEIELLASQALCSQGLVPKEDYAQMKAKAAFSLERCKELEKTLAFLDKASDGDSKKRNAALADVYWALLNSAEFVFNH